MRPTQLRRALSGLLAALLVGAVSHAAQEGHTVVTAIRSEDPATASPALDVSVTGEELARTGERSLPRALGRAAGVWVQETSLGGGAPVIGGLLGNRIVIVIDGVRMNDSTTRAGPNQSLNSIPPEIVERIDVIRGPGSVLYGSDAVGGTILIWTKRRAPAGEDAQARQLHGELTASVDSAAKGGRGSLSSSWAGKDDGFFVAGGYQNWGDLRAGGGEEFPTAYEGEDLFGSWVRALGEGREWRITGHVSRQHNVPRTDRLVTGYGQTQPSNSVWDFALQDRRRYVASYSDTHMGDFADRMELRLSMRTYREERVIVGTGDSTEDFQRDETTTLGVGVDWKKALGDAQLLTWGLDLDHDMVDSIATETDLVSGSTTPQDGAFAPDASYSSGGVFVQDEIFCLDPWDVTAGLRWSWYEFGFDDFPSAGTNGSQSGNFDAFTASLAAARDVAEGVRLTAQVGQGFRAPNLEDLANNSNFFGGTELGNPNLEPETSLTAQLALDVTRPAWSASLGVFHTWLEDLLGRHLIDPGDPGTTGDETYLRVNAGSARILGADLSGAHRLGGEGSPYSTEAGLSYAWGQQWDDSVDPATGEMPLYDVPFRRIPPLFGHVALVWDGTGLRDSIDRADLLLAFAASQERLHPEDMADPRINPEGTPGWGRVDLNAEGPLGSPDRRARTRWHVGLLNIFDKNYRVHASGLDAPGRALVLGLNVSL
jgi:hemoglobin/transferrin/lactoferrin receptor protein